MKDKPNDGGPAFPVVQEIREYDNPGGKCQEQIGSFGITMRDYFAAKAMQIELSMISGLPNSEDPEKIADSIAALSYDMADAMLRAREK